MPEETEPQGGEGDNQLIKSLRKQIADLTGERDELKSWKRSQVFEQAGVTEAGRKAMDRLYDGDLDPDQIRSFAADHGIAVATPDAEGGEGQPPAGQAEVSPDEQQRRAAQQRVNDVTNIGTTPPPANPADELNNKITEAEKAGDMRQAIALKAQKLERMRANA